MATSSQRRRQDERDAERERIRIVLDLGEDIHSLKTLRALQKFADRIADLEEKLSGPRP